MLPLTHLDLIFMGAGRCYRATDARTPASVRPRCSATLPRSPSRRSNSGAIFRRIEIQRDTKSSEEEREGDE